MYVWNTNGGVVYASCHATPSHYPYTESSAYSIGHSPCLLTTNWCVIVPRLDAPASCYWEYASTKIQFGEIVCNTPLYSQCAPYQSLIRQCHCWKSLRCSTYHLDSRVEYYGTATVEQSLLPVETKIWRSRKTGSGFLKQVQLNLSRNLYLHVADWCEFRLCKWQGSTHNNISLCPCHVCDE